MQILFIKSPYIYTLEYAKCAYSTQNNCSYQSSCRELTWSLTTVSLSHSMRLLFAPLVFIFRDYIVLSNVDDDNDDDRCNSGSYNHNGIDDD